MQRDFLANNAFDREKYYKQLGISSATNRRLRMHTESIARSSPNLPLKYSQAQDKHKSFKISFSSPTSKCQRAVNRARALSGASQPFETKTNEDAQVEFDFKLTKGNSVDSTINDDVSNSCSDSYFLYNEFD